MNLSIREISPDELPPAFEILRQVLRERLDYETFCERFARQKLNGYRLFGAIVDGRPIGVIGFRPVETMARGPHLHVDELVVSGEQRRLGIGRRLLEFAEEYGKTNSLLSVFLDSGPEVTGFYEALGYRPHTAVLMRKKLGDA